MDETDIRTEAAVHSCDGCTHETASVVDVHFRNNAKVYFFDPAGLTPAAGDHVIIETARGDEFGICASGVHEVPVCQVVAPLRKVLRLATERDERINEENRQKESRAFEICQQKIAAHGLEMQLVSAEAAFDGSKLLFFFTADGRVDFRELVKDLASVFRTRIELRQIGVRDKAKMVGGLGVCGRPFCCKEFLDDFQPVSIKMAKTQNLSLNPTKISGTCGRLMCCLKYEQEAYEDLLKTAPKNESFVDTPDGRGTITEVNLLRQSVKVRMEDHPETIGSYKNTDICVLRSGKARKNDPPIPKELAPISSQPRKKPKEDFFEALPDVIYPDEVAVFENPDAFNAEKPLEIPKSPAPRNKRRRKKPQQPSQQQQLRTEGKPQQPRPEGKQQKRPPQPPRAKQVMDAGSAITAAEAPPQPAAKPRKPRRKYRGPRNGGAQNSAKQ